jgi:hypothetical protein
MVNCLDAHLGFHFTQINDGEIVGIVAPTNPENPHEHWVNANAVQLIPSRSR